MKIDFNKIFIMSCMFIIWGTMLILLFSCSPEYHFNRFQKKGGKVECKGDTVIREITTTIKGKDGRIDTVREKVPYIEYLTRWETKWKYKIQRDSIDVIKYQTKWKTKEVIKTKRIEEDSLWWFWYILGIATPIALYLLIVRFARI
jgi:hypothetical protein